MERFFVWALFMTVAPTERCKRLSQVPAVAAFLQVPGRSALKFHVVSLGEHNMYCLKTTFTLTQQFGEGGSKGDIRKIFAT